MACALATQISGIAASRNLHHEVIVSLLNTPLSYFDQTPIGRIMNRCSDDIAEIDLVMPFTIRSMFNVILGAVGMCGIIFYTTPLVAVAIPVFVIVYVPIQVGQSYMCMSSTCRVKMIAGLFVWAVTLARAVSVL